jgi:hypothetical protein
MILLESLKLRMSRVILPALFTFVPAEMYSANYYVTVTGSGTFTGESRTNAMDSRTFARKLMTAVVGDVFYPETEVYRRYFDIWGNESGSGSDETLLIGDGVAIREDFDAGYQHYPTGVARYRGYPAPANAYGETEVKASDDFLHVDSTAASVNILDNDSYPDGCSPTVTLLTTSTGMAASIVYSHPNLIYTPNRGAKGMDTVRYRIQCSGGKSDSAIVAVEIGRHYDRPQNILDETACMRDMPAVKFQVRRKIYNNKVQVDGFSMPLVGDLNGDRKPEIVGLGAVADGGGKISGLDAVGKSVVIYDGQTGDIVLNFDLNSLGNNSYTSVSGYGTRFGFQLRWDPRHNSYSHLALADLDNDGVGEIVVAETASGRVYALKPEIDRAGKIYNLRKIWDAQVQHKSPYVANSYVDSDAHTFGAPTPYVSDINGDGVVDVVVYNKIYNGRSGRLELELEELNRFDDPAANRNAYEKAKQYAFVGRLASADNADDCMPVMAINDIDDDGIMEIIAGSKIYKPKIVNADSPANNSFSVIHGPKSITMNGSDYFLTDGFTAVADIDGDDALDVIVIKRHVDRARFVIYVWDPRVPGNAGLKAWLKVRHSANQGHFSVPFIGDINGRNDGWNGNGYSRQLPEICMTISRLNNDANNPVSVHPQSKIPDYTDGKYTGNDGSGMDFLGHIVAFTYDAKESSPSKRLKLSWLMKHSDVSHQTGIVMFDFDADGVSDLVYRDELALRVISPARRIDGFDYVHLGVNPANHPDVIRFRESNITSYTGFEAPVIADVNGDGSADIITFAIEAQARLNNSAGHLFVFEASGESWAPSRPVWNQGIYCPLQINNDLSVPRHPQSTLTKYYSKPPHAASGKMIQPFNGNWIQQPVVRKGNYVPVLITSDPSITADDVKIVSSSATRTVVRLTIKNRGESSANSQTPLTFYHTSIAKANKIMTANFQRDIFKDSQDTFEYILTGDWRNKIIYVRLVDNGSATTFPPTTPIDCNPSNNTVRTMQVTAVDDYYSLTNNNTTYFNVCINDTCNRNARLKIEIADSARHGLAATVADSVMSYTANTGFQGVDTVRYRIVCTYDTITVTGEATVYILVWKAAAQEYVACKGTVVPIEFTPAAGVEYNWFGVEKGGTVLHGGRNTAKYNAVKKDADETLWVQIGIKGFAENRFPRFGIILREASDCDGKHSTCYVGGTILFSDGFGENLSTDTLAAGQFYKCRLDGLCDGLTLNIAARAASVAIARQTTKGGIVFTVEDSIGNVLSRYQTVRRDSNETAWNNYEFSFTVPERVGSLTFRIINSSDSGSFVIDDVEIRLCVPEVKIADIDSDTVVCVNNSLTIKGQYPAEGNPFGDSLRYRWEFRHIDSSRWTVVSEYSAVPPIDVAYTIPAVTKAHRGDYRLRIGSLKNIDAARCFAMSKHIRLHVLKAAGYPDLRIQLSTRPARTVNLTSFIDSAELTTVHWEKGTLFSPAIIAGTEKTSGSINTADFINITTYTYKYTMSSKCGSSTSKAYIRTLKDKVLHIPDTITVCRSHEAGESLNLNHILGLELGGSWKYDSTVNPDSTVSANVTYSPPSSKHAGALTFNAIGAWNMASSSRYSINYRGHTNAKIFKFRYSPAAGSSDKTTRELLIVVTD